MISQLDVDGSSVGSDPWRGLGYAAPLRATDEVTLEDTRLSARKVVNATDPYLAGHYPRGVVYPGNFTIETVHQAVRQAVFEQTGRMLALSAVRSARFTAPLQPGDTLIAEADLTWIDRETLAVAARCHDQRGIEVSRMKLRLSGAPSDPEPSSDPLPEVSNSASSLTLDHADVRSLLPHRFPVLLVDRVTALEPGRRLEAIKAVTASEPCYAPVAEGSSSAADVYPVTLAMESLGQASALLWAQSADPRTQRGTLIFGGLRNCVVSGAAVPGDQLRHQVELELAKGDTAFLRGQTWAGDRLLLSVESMTIARRHVVAGDL